MSRKITSCVLLVLAIFGTALSNVGSANSISITNASFENPKLDDGAYTTPKDGDGWCSWTSGGGASYIINPDSSSYASASGSGTPTGANGANLLGIVTGLNVAAETVAWQDVGSTFEDGKTYRLDVAVGKRLVGLAPADTFSISIRTAANTTLAQYNGTADDLTSGAFVDKSVSYTVSNSAVVGSGIRVMLGLGTGSHGYQQAIDFDNVRLSTIPEPGTLALLTAGVIGLICYAWRKRK